ncbi:MAG: hypothetical protein ACO3VQ_05180 [Ilumatobacteraceae bacterium]
MKSEWTIAKTDAPGGGWIVRKRNYQRVKTEEPLVEGQEPEYVLHGKQTARAFTALYHARRAIALECGKPRIRMIKLSETHYTYEHETE